MAMTNAERQAAFKKRQKEKAERIEESLDDKVKSFEDFIQSMKDVLAFRRTTPNDKLKMISEIIQGYEKSDAFDEQED